MSSVVTVAAHQSTQALKWIVGAHDAIDRSLWSIDAWTNRTTRVSLIGARDGECVCCGARHFEFLAGTHEDQTAILCGRNAVQVAPQRTSNGAVLRIDLERATVTLAPHGQFVSRDGLLVGTLREPRAANGDEIHLTVFADGRAIIKGSTDEVFARSIYDRFVAGLAKTP